MAVLDAVVVSVFSAGIVGLLGWLGRRYWRAALRSPRWIGAHVSQLWRRLRATPARWHRRMVVRRASAFGVRVPIRRSGGYDRVTVHFSDGAETHHYRSHEQYRRDMQALRTPPGSSFTTAPPTPVSQWSAKACKTWLAEHPRQGATWLDAARARVNRFGRRRADN